MFNIRGGERDTRESRAKDVTIQELCRKLEEFLVVQEREREEVKGVERRLQETQEEVGLLRERLQEKERKIEEGEEGVRRRQEGQEMDRLAQLVSQQTMQVGNCSLFPAPCSFFCR